MSVSEALSVLAQFCQVIVIIFGFRFAAGQIREARRALEAVRASHLQNHELQRKVAAQAAIQDFNYSALSAELIVALGYTDNSSALTVEAIEAKFAQCPGTRSKLIMLFRHYEGLARGINHGIYDEEVVKSAHRTTFIRFLRIFSVYIRDRQTKLNIRLWGEFTDLAEKWEREATAVARHEPTGRI